MAKQKFNFGAIKATSENVSTEEIAVKEQEPTQIETMAKKIINPIRENNFEVKIVPRKKIRFNKKNKYSIKKIEQLEKSILYNGLQQNLCGIYSMEEDKYILETGHKRTTAIDNLIERYSSWSGDIEDTEYQLYLKNVSTFEKGYPVKITAILDDAISYDEVEEDNLSEMPVEVIDSEIRLHETNLLARDSDEMTAAERTRFVQRLASLYEEKNNRGKRSDRININKTLGEQFGVSERQIANMRSVTKLIPGLQEEFDKNNITLKDATGYANLTEEEQQIILDIIKSGEKVSRDEVALLKMQKEETQQKNEQLAEKLAEKERELRRLREKQKVVPAQNEEAEKLAKERLKEIQERDNYIKQLERDVEKMKKEAQEQPVKKDLEPKQVAALKRSLALKNTLKACEKEIAQLHNNAYLFVAELTGMSPESQGEIDIIEKEDILKSLSELEKVIDIVKRKIEE